MSDTNRTPDSSTGKSALERRRVLFKGLFGGAAAAGAGMPLKAHANYTGKYCDKQGGKGRKAEASTHGSVVSLANGNNNECKGHKRDHYCSSGNWPSSCNRGNYWSNYTSGGVITKDTKFCRAFNFASSSTGKKDMTLWQLCNDTTDSVERTYAIAFANANKLFGSTFPQFPYEPADVVVLYRDPMRVTQGKALFDNYLSTMS